MAKLYFNLDLKGCEVSIEYDEYTFATKGNRP